MIFNLRRSKRLDAYWMTLVGAQQCRSWHVEAERLGSLKIDDELEFRCPLVRKIGGIGALENLVHEEGRVAIRAVPVALVVKNTLATLYGEEVQQGKKAGQLSDPVPSAKNGLYCPDCRAPCAKIGYTVYRATFSACESCP